MNRRQRRTGLWLAIFSVVWLLAGSGGTQGLEDERAPEQLALAGHIGGPALATAAYGDYALVGYSFEFAVVDVSDAAHPRRVAYLMLPANDIEAVGTLAYVAGRDSLNAISLVDPHQPDVIGSAALDDAATGLAAFDNRAYVTVRNGLYAFDVSDPRRPHTLAWLALPGRSEGVAVEGDYAYVTGSAGVHVVDVTDAAHPQLVASLPTGALAEAAALADDILYVANGDAGLAMIDVSAPAQPALVASVDTPGYAAGVDVANGVAYVADGPAGVQLVDVREVRAPAVVHTLAGGRFVLDVVAGGGRLLSVDRERGLAVAVLDADAAPQAAGRLQTPGFMGSVAVYDGLAYVIGTQGSSVHVVDVSDEGQLRQTGRVETLGMAERVAVDGDVAYIADGYGGLQILDVAQRRLLTGDESAFAFGDVQDVKALGDYALLAGPGGIQAVSVADPQRPLRVGCSCGNGAVYRLAVEGNLAYAAAGESGLHIVDFTDPAQPQLLARVQLPGPAEDLALLDGYAYVAGGESGLHVVDVREPARPVYVTSLTAAAADAITADGGRLYVVEREVGLCVYDAADPASPVETARFATPDLAVSVAAADGMVYVTDCAGGLFLLRAERG